MPARVTRADVHASFRAAVDVGRRAGVLALHRELELVPGNAANGVEWCVTVRTRPGGARRADWWPPLGTSAAEAHRSLTAMRVAWQMLPARVASAK